MTMEELFVVVTHDPRWQEFADHTILLCDGQVHKKRKIYDRPRQMGIAGCATVLVIVLSRPWHHAQQEFGASSRDTL